ncbi:hypothetical protein Pcinc_005671 [Petrolisthes cinctipes]|uniref:Uncharacterized protein n=1 Tax=Petrolisthes cinctipes TaxID=88211 RepID=A0AAE1GEP9_PETCI|nr:hypothetical protein Pcinc_005671 [Petrolisthes cinctipes]
MAQDDLQTRTEKSRVHSSSDVQEVLLGRRGVKDHGWLSWKVVNWQLFLWSILQLHPQRVRVCLPTIMDLHQEFENLGNRVYSVDISTRLIFKM